jgi:hypothetical protein
LPSSLGVLASDIANGQNSSWGTYIAKTLAGVVTGAVMGGFAGALGFRWFASRLLTHAGPFGMLYGMTFRRTDQIFGEMFDLHGYRERDFWDKAWYIFNPANMALDYGLAAALQGLGNCIKFGTPTPPKTQAGAAETAPVPTEAGSNPAENALAPDGQVGAEGVGNNI